MIIVLTAKIFADYFEDGTIDTRAFLIQMLIMLPVSYTHLYEVSGKTGTAERAGKDGGYEEGNNMASFMGFVSTKDPRVLCLSLIHI